MHIPLVLVGCIQNPLLVVLVLDAFLVQYGIHFPPRHPIVLRDLRDVEQTFALQHEFHVACPLAQFLYLLLLLAD